MGIPLSATEANLPNILTYLLGITVLYSNQKSNKSPNKKIAAAFFSICSSHLIKILSRYLLKNPVGAPKC